jgi:carboxylesterase
MKLFIYLSLSICLFTACKKSEKLPPIDNTIDLDGTTINDSSLTHPEKFLLSVANPIPSIEDKSTPVFIAVHGFTASTFEWLEFKNFVKSNGNALISVVLLGGHGRDYTDFKNATWEDWQAPIITEYNALRALGYTNISFIGSSTGCPLLLEAISAKKLNTDVLKKVFFIDPIIVPSNKTLALISAVGPALGYSESTMEQGENGFWYKYRPYQALEQLNSITQIMRKKLEDGITLPDNVSLTVYKAKKDGAADPIGAALLYNGITNKEKLKVTIINSELHVFTRLKGRNVITSEDLELQNNIFNEILPNL